MRIVEHHKLIQTLSQNLVISIAAGLFAIESQILILDYFYFSFASAAFLITWSVYSFLRKEVLGKAKQLLVYSAFLTFGASVLNYFTYFNERSDDTFQNFTEEPFVPLLTIGASSILVLLYDPSLFIRKISWSGLRGYTWIKPLIIAYSWVLITTAMQFLFDDFAGCSPWMFIEKLLFVYALAIASDIVDVERDQTLRTVPKVYGISFAKRIIYFVLCVQCSIVFLAGYDTIQTVAIASTSIITIILIASLKEGYQNRSVIAVDTMFVIRAAAILLLYYCL